MKPLTKLSPLSHKTKQPTILSLGSIRPMKRTMHQLRAFELAKRDIPDLQLIVAGGAGSHYGRKVLRAIARSPYTADITYAGRVSDEEKVILLQKAHLILQTSIKEGWGLTVTEAASQGTPAVVYNVDGLRDSVHDGKTGIIVEQNNPQRLAAGIVTMLADHKRYGQMRKFGWQWSKSITFEKSYKQFNKLLMA